MDTTVPNAARMYDYMLGGKDNFAVDRAAVKQVIKISGGDAIAGAKASRAFLRRAVGFLAETGIEQFLDIGAGLPTQGNVHEVARRVNPAARVVYVDYDPMVLNHGRAILGRDDRVEIVCGDVRDLAPILATPAVRRLIDFEQPVAILLVAVLHFVPDTADPSALVAQLREAIAPGSHLALSHGTGDTRTRREVDQAVAVYRQTTAEFVPRSVDEIRRLFYGFDLVEPGLVYPPLWRPTRAPTDAEVQHASGMLCAVGRRT